MKHLLRALTLAAVVGTALALTGSAFAAFTTPRLTVNAPTAGSVTIGYTQTKDDDALNRLQIYVPTGYSASLDGGARRDDRRGHGGRPGERDQRRRHRPADRDDPRRQPDRRDAQRAARRGLPRGRARPNAVWVLVLQSPTGPLEVPVYVIAATAAPESAFAAAKLVLCLPSPYIPQAARRRGARREGDQRADDGPRR